MSLSLIGNYSSAEDEEEDDGQQQPSLTGDDEENESDDSTNTNTDEESTKRNHPTFQNLLFNNPNPPSNSLLPSAFDVFSEVAGPPEFLNNCVAEHVLAEDNTDQRGRRGGLNGNLRDKRDRPAGVVLEAKAQLVGVREQVRSDTDGKPPTTEKESSRTTTGEGKRVSTATNPDAKDAAELLRMCLQCGIPKTYSNARGMVCPVCGDRPVDPDKESEKKKGSTIKDKEKNKRMKGQSSHATWKSETEMQLRQQFD